MTNAEKFKTAEERVSAFDKFCIGRDCMKAKGECPPKTRGACFVLRWRKVLAKAAGGNEE